MPADPAAPAGLLDAARLCLLPGVGGILGALVVAGTGWRS